jgi:hypothetical protein
MKTAQQWFSPGNEENGQEGKTTENLGNVNSDATTTPTTTATTTTTTTVTAAKRIDYNNNDDDDYYYDDSADGRPYRADVIDAVPPLAVR